MPDSLPCGKSVVSDQKKDYFRRFRHMNSQHALYITQCNIGSLTIIAIVALLL